MSSNLNIMYLCNFDTRAVNFDSETLKKLWTGNWNIEETEICKQLFSYKLENDTLLEILQKYSDDSFTEKILDIAISAFLTYCNSNWSTVSKNIELEEYFGTVWPKDVDVHTKLQCDSEPICSNILYPELLYFSSQIFNTLYTIDQDLVYLWWMFRIKVMHQRALEETSASLFNDLEIIIAKLCNESQKLDHRIKVLLFIEIAQAYLIYGRIQKVEEYLVKAKELAGLKLELTGVLGKRTKYQQNVLPQLALTSELDANVMRDSAEMSHGDSELPPDVELQDDLRLNKIHFVETINQIELPSLEQTLCLLTVQYIQKSQPKDDLLTEELQPYISAILSQQKGPWSTRVAALLIRCKLEANHKRTVERSMMQCETIVNDKTDVSATTRLSYVWASGMPMSWCWRQQLGELYVGAGLVKAALEQFQRLRLWEDVVLCYTLLQLRHKAAEVIQQQIDIKPTVKLYCLLGDATDDVSCYEKAWEFSNHKSSRAQRHWGNFLFNQKKYEECIPHYEKSVEINSIQESVWARLGYAALLTEQWELSGKAYRRYTYLHPNTFEAWNNLAKVYVQQGDKQRAYKCLMESLRYNYDNWKLWENIVLVSMETGHVEEVVRGVHRLLDLRGKYEDLQVLTLLVHTILHRQGLGDDDSEARLRKRALELFGRITSIHQNKPEIWQLYSDLSTTYLLKAQRLLKAYKGYTQSGDWPNNPETCIKVMELTQNLLEHSLKARQEVEDNEKLQAEQQLSSARLTGQAVIRAVEKQDWPETKTLLEELKNIFNTVTDYIKSIM
ncbi:PREDICTED: tetratricopeptide repeat protein 27 [Papilio polytes]|uniref:tetratricopeptide repeat protein 27 n=1 Tax=Papilio polytes TaxID=76194 RepID=UPI000675D4E4|nr:PREDICTED: tetratricopeptide repeat protein 27 [Papilio polytes]